MSRLRAHDCYVSHKVNKLRWLGNSEYFVTGSWDEPTQMDQVEINLIGIITDIFILNNFSVSKQIMFLETKFRKI